MNEFKTPCEPWRRSEAPFNEFRREFGSVWIHTETIENTVAKQIQIRRNRSREFINHINDQKLF
jgi:hypothetical protein